MDLNVSSAGSFDIFGGPGTAALGLEVAEATYRAAVARWPAARITLRQGIRAVHD
jgi:hypothetical protein